MPPTLTDPALDYLLATAGMELTDAQKSLFSYRACTKDAREQKYAEAVAEARAGLAVSGQQRKPTAQASNTNRTLVAQGHP